MKKQQTLQVQCPACGKPFEAVAAAAGQQGLCPSCGAPVIIPRPEGVAPGGFIDESRKRLSTRALIWSAVGLLCILLGEGSKESGLVWIGSLILGSIVVTWGLLIAIYLRAIALALTTRQ